MRKDTANFIQSAEYDLETAKYMFNSERYIYVVFMCHLCIEKISKAICAEVLKKNPPKTHNIIYLFKIGKFQIPKELFEFVAKINNASVVTRYPEDFQKLSKAFPREIAKEYLLKTEEVFKCLREKLRK